MNVILSYAFFVLCNNICISNARGDDYKLELVQVLFRHGDRIPDKMEVYKTDPYDPSFYEYYGYGQLTKIGMQREYKIGQLLRQRYDNFLAEYNVDNVYAYSTDFDRTKMSLQLVLSGLYPPTAKTRWNNQIFWHPVSMHFNPFETDFLLIDFYGQGSPSGYYQLLQEARKSSQVRNRYEKYADFLDYVSNKTGISNLQPFTATLITSNIHCTLSMGLPLPNWCTEQDYEKLQDILTITYDAMVHTQLMRKLAIGPTIDRFLENIRNSEESSDKRKIYLYSAHDVNIAFFNRAHNFTGIPPNPDFGSTIIMEKLRGKDDRVYVKMLLWTGVSEKLIPLKLQNCSYECPLSDYIDIVELLLPDYGFSKCTTSKTLCRTVQARTKKINIDSNLMLPYLSAAEELYLFKYADEVSSPNKMIV